MPSNTVNLTPVGVSPASVAAAIATALTGTAGNLAAFDGNGAAADVGLLANDVSDAVTRVPYLSTFANIAQYGAAAITQAATGGTVTTNATTNTAAFVAAAAAAIAAGHRTVYVPGCDAGFCYFVNKLDHSNFFTDGTLTVIGSKGWGAANDSTRPDVPTGPTSVLKSATGDHIFALTGGSVGYHGTEIAYLKLIGLRSSGTTGDGIHVDPTSGTDLGIGNSMHFHDLIIQDCSGRGINFAGTQAQWSIIFERITIDQCKLDCFQFLNSSTITTLRNVLVQRPGDGYWGFRFEGAAGTHIHMINCGGTDNYQGSQTNAPFGGGISVGDGITFTADRLHLEAFTGTGLQIGTGAGVMPHVHLRNPYILGAVANSKAIRWFNSGGGATLNPTIIDGPNIDPGNGSWANSAAFHMKGLGLPRVVILNTRGISSGTTPFDDLTVYHEDTTSSYLLPVSYVAQDTSRTARNQIIPAYQSMQIDNLYPSKITMGGPLLPKVVALGTTGTITAPDASLGNHFYIRPLTGSVTIPKALNGVDGQEITFEIWQAASGGPYTVTFAGSGSYGFIGGAQTAMGSTANKVTCYRFRYSGYSGDWIETQPAAVNVR